MKCSFMKNNLLGSFKNYVLILVILLLAYLPFSSFLFALKNDAFTDNFPDKFFFSAALHNGFLPLWNPYMNFGFPIYADPGFAFYNPITWFFGIVGYNAYTFTIEVLLYLYIAGLTMYSLCKYLVFDNRVCVAVAAMFMCSGFFVGNLQHINFLTSAAFIPLVIKYLLSTLSDPCFKNSFFLAIAYYFIIASGHPAIPIASFYFFLFLTLSILISSQDSTISLQKKIGYILLSALICFSLCLPVIYSYVNILPVYSSAAPIPSEKLIRGGSSFSSLVSLILPYSTIRDNLFFDTDLSMRNLYISIIALLSLLAVKPKKVAVSFIITGSILFLFSVGGNVKHLIYSHLLGLNHIRINGVFRMFTIVSFCIAAGFSLDYIIRNVSSERLNKRLKITCLSLLSIFSIFLIYVIIDNPVFTHLKGQTNLPFGISYVKWMLNNLSFPDCLFISLSIAITFLTGLYLLISRKLYHFIPILIILDVALNLIIYLPITGVGQKSVAYVQDIYNRSPKGIPIPSLKPIEQLDSISTDESNLVGDWSYYNKQIGTMKITDYPSYFLSLDQYFGSDYTSFLNKNPFLFTKQSTSKISVAKFSPQGIEVNCSSSIPDTLIFLQNNYKFWQVRINGNNQPITSAFYSFMSVPIPKGESKIVFSYKDWGLLISFILSFIFLCAYLFFIYSPKKTN